MLTEKCTGKSAFGYRGVEQNEEAVALETDKTTVGKALAALENKECVIRTQDEADKRIKRLSLTAAGREKVAELVDIHNNWLHDIMTCLSPEEQKQFENYCGRLLIAAENLTDNGGIDQ